MSKISTNNFKDLTGQTFGYLKILEKTDKRINGSVVWKCECQKCGSICFGDQHSIQRGHKISCGCLTSKGEAKIQRILTENNISFKKQQTFETCRFSDTNAKAFFDFYVDNSYLIEYDGDIHFNSTRGWNTEENFLKIQQRDAFKNNWCKEHNIPLIRIPYTHYDNLCLEDLKLETSNFIII